MPWYKILQKSEELHTRLRGKYNRYFDYTKRSIQTLLHIQSTRNAKAAPSFLQHDGWESTSTNFDICIVQKKGT